MYYLFRIRVKPRFISLFQRSSPLCACDAFFCGKYALFNSVIIVCGVFQKKTKDIYRQIFSCSFQWCYDCYSETLSSGRKFKLKVQTYFSQSISCFFFFFSKCILPFESTILNFQNTLILRVREMKGSEEAKFKKRATSGPARSLRCVRANFDKCSAPFRCFILQNIIKLVPQTSFLLIKQIVYFVFQNFEFLQIFQKTMLLLDKMRRNHFTIIIINVV